MTLLQQTADLINDAKCTVKANKYWEIMLPISVALDRAQGSEATISVSVETWHNLEIDLSTKSSAVKRCLQQIRDKALSGAHYLANIIDHRFRGRNLSEDEKKNAYDYLNSIWTELIQIVMAVEVGDQPFPSYLFQQIFQKVTSITWWKQALSSVENTQLQQKMMSFCVQLLTGVASTAGLERILSSFGLVQSKLRNRLGNEKAAKLIFLVTAFNINSIRTSRVGRLSTLYSILIG